MDRPSPPNGNQVESCRSEAHAQKNPCVSKCELTQKRGFMLTAMWYSVPAKIFTVPVIHIQIGLGNDVLNNLLYLIDCYLEKLSTGEEVARNTLVTLNQVIAKILQNRQIWDVNDGVMLRRKDIQLKRLQAMKESTPGLNDDLVITIASAEFFVKNKK